VDRKNRAAQDGAVASLRPANARTHSKEQIRQMADSSRQFGFTNPVLIGEDGGIIAGRGRVPRLAAASKDLNFHLPTDLNEVVRRDQEQIHGPDRIAQHERK
jgi:hypothetical protein